MVNDYADTDKTTQILSENFEGFSQMFKEQSGEKCTIYMCQAGGGGSGSLGEYSRCLKAAVVILKGQCNEIFETFY